MRYRLTWAAAAALALPAVVTAATWDLDPAHSSVQFSVRHLMVSNVRGEFGKLSGTVQGDEADPTHSKIEAEIDAASINTRIEKRDTHLRSADFLDVAKYPKITFVSTKIEPAGAGHFKVSGDLTLHGVTRPVVLDVEGPTPEIKDPWGKTRAGAQATAKIDRKDFGIAWNQTLDAGGVAVGDEVTITIDVEATKRAAGGAAETSARKTSAVEKQ
ncbi:MAG: YceI family protein [Deltaproteobacteria bacterium]|nr:MAG: YceI family protein [Deltaproteobacteria bacterium]